MLNTKRIALGLIALLVLASGCGNLGEQPKLHDPYAESPTFGRAIREPLPQAVPVGHLNEDQHLYAGMVDGAFAEDFPMALTATMVREGQELYNGFCSPCHGYSGYGNGVVIQEGFTQPQSFHLEEVRNKPVGHYFNVITNGQNSMYSYAGRIEPEERWAIVAYIRALQLSQNATLEELPQEVQDEFETAAGG